ncbi:hypothetical protein [Actinoplanes sp. SE50/110]|uniref:hypothetical protein n=1 Tax=Actinoplanes sp. (strain ATCC 31044 / CBS 674.73 / SE50/110) TaxID=134676 RepID=UPI00155F8A9B|nr:hypothetical protein [Actinoplanes sp. SE50/110]
MTSKIGRIAIGMVSTPLLLFVAIPLVLALLDAVTSAGNQTGEMDRTIQWMFVIEVAPFLTEPIREFIDARAAELSVSADVLWSAWQFTALAILVAGFTGVLWARIARLGLCLSIGGMLWVTTTGLHRQATLSFTLAWLMLEVVLSIRPVERLRRSRAIELLRRFWRNLTRPQLASYEQQHLEIEVLPEHSLDARSGTPNGQPQR